jgi:hypothetical protein
VITTFTEQWVDLLNFRPEDVNIRDIAHHLACVNRWAGALPRPVNVAQHSIHVARLCADCSKEIQLQALLHDASEAYLGDVTKWLKHSPVFEEYRKLEEHIQNTIFGVFGVPLVMDPRVEAADKLMVRFEGFNSFGASWDFKRPNYPPITAEECKQVGYWYPWNWRLSELIFKETFERLNA